MPAITKQQPVQPPVSNNGPIRSAWDSSKHVRMLLYGRSGTGKTTLWATFPKPIRALICSGGGRPGELKSIDTPENRASIDARVVTSSQDFADWATPGEFSTIVVDHGSGLQDLVLAEILGLKEVPIAKYKIAGKGESWGIASKQQYGQCVLRCKEMFRQLLNLSANVVIVAHERSFKDDDADDSVVMPSIGAAMTPSLTGWLNGACDYICETLIRQKEVTQQTTVGTGPLAKTIETRQKVKGVEYCLRTAPDPVYMTKFRLPNKGASLPEVILDPDYAKILSLINSTVSK